jgi:hypothetical protein
MPAIVEKGNRSQLEKMRPKPSDCLFRHVGKNRRGFVFDRNHPATREDFMRLGARERVFFAAALDSGQKSIGLGLNIVKEIAVLHKGDVKLENRPDKGVRATLILPVVGQS